MLLLFCDEVFDVDMMCFALIMTYVAVNVLDLTHSFYYVLVSVSVFVAFSTVFYSINSSDSSPLSHSVLLV